MALRQSKIIQNKPQYKLSVERQEDSVTPSIHTVSIIREIFDSEGNLEATRVDQYNFSTEELQRFAEAFSFQSRQKMTDKELFERTLQFLESIYSDKGGWGLTIAGDPEIYSINEALRERIYGKNTDVVSISGYIPADIAKQKADAIVNSLIGENNADKWWSSRNKSFDMRTPAGVWLEDHMRVYNYLIYWTEIALD